MDKCNKKITKNDIDFVIGRDAMLNEFNVKKFRKWILKNNPMIYRQILFFNDTPKAETVLLATMCKMCIASNGVTNETKEKAMKELDKLGMSYGIE